MAEQHRHFFKCELTFSDESIVKSIAEKLHHNKQTKTCTIPFHWPNERDFNGTKDTLISASITLDGVKQIAILYFNQAKFVVEKTEEDKIYYKHTNNTHGVGCKLECISDTGMLLGLFVEMDYIKLQMSLKSIKNITN